MCLREALPGRLALPPYPLPRAESPFAPLPQLACACPSCVQARKGSARSLILGGHVGVSRSPPRVAAPLPSPVPANSPVADRHASAGRRCGTGRDRGMHGGHARGLKPCPALAAAISELSIAIAFALSTIILPPLWGL